MAAAQISPRTRDIQGSFRLLHAEDGEKEKSFLDCLVFNLIAFGGEQFLCSFSSPSGCVTDTLCFSRFLLDFCCSAVDSTRKCVSISICIEGKNEAKSRGLKIIFDLMVLTASVPSERVQKGSTKNYQITARLTLHLPVLRKASLYDFNYFKVISNRRCYIVLFLSSHARILHSGELKNLNGLIIPLKLELSAIRHISSRSRDGRSESTNFFAVELMKSLRTS